MKRRLTHNLGLKILAVVLAVFTWLIMVNVSNPIMTATQTVPVEVINDEVLKDANLTYELKGRDTVTVSYRVHVRDQYRISPSDFSVYADLSQLYDVTGAVPLQAEVSNRAVRQYLSGDSVTVSPSVVNVQTEPIQTKMFALKAYVTGEVETGHAVGEVTMTPSLVYVTGAESVVGQISTAGIDINVDEAAADVNGEAKVNVYDANDHILELDDDITLSVSTVNYTVPVLRVKDLTLDFQVTGQVANGYRFTGVTSDVQSVSVEGLRSALANLNTLTLSGDALDITGATQDVVATVNLADYLPENVSIVGDSSARATVTMRVEPLASRTLSYDVGMINMLGISEQYRYSFVTQHIDLRIRGLEDELDALGPGDVEVSMDLNGLEPGEHQVELTVSLSKGFDFVGPASVTVRIEAETEEGDGETTSASEQQE